MTSTERPKVYGANYSTYVRTVRLTLAEKQVPYELVNVDVFAIGGPPVDYLKIHPFGRIPAFEHDGFRMYEAVPIARYIDESFSGPPLQPSDARERARMNQVIGILDSYAYRTLVWDIYVERSSKQPPSKIPDEHRIMAALPRARTCLNALADLMGDGQWLAGKSTTLADLHAVPIFDYFLRTLEGQELVTSVRSLLRWWHEIEQRPSVRATKPD
jgi:glutathione S-transferase